MDHQKLFQTVGDYRTKASFKLHHHHHHHHHHSNSNSNSNSTSPGLPDHLQSSPASVVHSTGTGSIAPAASSPSVPRGLFSAPPSSSATGPVSCSSTPTTAHTTDHHFTHSTLSSPVSFDNSNGILCAASILANNGPHNGYMPISNHNLPHHLNYNNFLLPTSFSPSHSHPNATDHSNFAAAVNHNTTATMHPTTGLVIRDGDMDHASYYCFDRGNGQFTPLIALDQLPADIMLGMPARVASDENMIILPEPRLPVDAADNQALAKFADLSVTVKPPTSPHHGGGPNQDIIQSRIDNIVAQNPNRQNALVLARNSKNAAGGGGGGNGGNNNLVLSSGSGSKREKIYCDKWIHDGTCAFTQQGCKFKHEMPGDRETQQGLGLFHGYPAWWKKKCAEENMPVDIVLDRPVGGGGGYRNVLGRLTGGGGVATTATAGGSGGNNNAESSIASSSALASNNWRRRVDVGPPQTPQVENTTPVAVATTPLSAGSNGSSGGGGPPSRSPWQPRSRVVGGNVPSRGAVARYNIPHFAQPNFGPIAPPSQAATGFHNNNSRDRGGSVAHRNTNNNTGGNKTAPAEQQLHPGMPGLARTPGGGGVPLRGAPADQAGSEDSINDQGTDEMGNASGVKL